MKLAFASNAFTSGRYTLEDAIRIIAREGYEGVEILADRPLLWLPTVTRAEIRAIKDILRETGLGVSCINGFTSSGYYGDRKAPPGQQFGPAFSDLDEPLRTWRVGYTKRIVDFAVEIGAQDISVSSGNPPPVPDNGDLLCWASLRNRAWRLMIEAIREVVDYARPRGVHINIEYEPGLLVGGYEDTLAVLRDVVRPNFGVNFDIGHSYVCGENVVDQIVLFQGKINGVQVEDIASKDGKRLHYHLVPGEGEMPLRDIFSMFRETGYSGWFTVELYNHFRHPVAVLQRSYRSMKRLLSEVQDT